MTRKWTGVVDLLCMALLVYEAGTRVDQPLEWHVVDQDVITDISWRGLLHREASVF